MRVPIAAICIMLSAGALSVTSPSSARLSKLIRRDKCRETVQRDMKKYQDVVKRLTARVNTLEKDLKKVYEDRKRQDVVIDELRDNFTAQDLRLQSILKEMATASEKRTKSNTGRVASVVTGYPRDCDEVHSDGGMKYAGDYQILIKPNSSKTEFKVVCNVINNAGWVTIHRRSSSMTNFNRGWAEYKEGFGDLSSDFWLGNEKLHQITTQGNYSLRVEMEDFEGRKFWAEYSYFRIDSELQQYRARVSGYRGDAGDSLLNPRSSVEGAKFSTYDKDNDSKFFENCADVFMGGWWYNECRSHLNGEYAPTELQNSVFMTHGVVWSTPQFRRALRFATMMVAPQRQSNGTAAAV